MAPQLPSLRVVYATSAAQHEPEITPELYRIFHVVPVADLVWMQNLLVVAPNRIDVDVLPELVVYPNWFRFATVLV